MTGTTLAGTAIVTGVLGQDGRLLADRLAAAGWRVVGVVRPERLGEPAPCPLAALDLADPVAVEAFVGALKPERIFHVAAVHHSSEGPPGGDPLLWRAMTAINFLATTHLIQAIARQAPACRLVYASSSQTQRPGEADRRVAAGDPREPPTYYGLTKSWAMDAIRFARERHGLFAAAAVLFNHESPARPESFVSRRISLGAARIRLGLADRLTLRNIGARADWFDAGDAVDALMRVAEADEPGDVAVGSGTASSVRDLLEAAFTHLGLDWRAYVTYDEDRHTPALIADTTAARERLGWIPATPITQTIQRMAKADLATLSKGQDHNL